MNNSTTRAETATVPAFPVFAERLSDGRTAAGLTQDELAKRCGISRKQLIRYESGSADAPGTFISACAQLLGVTTDWLLGHDHDFAHIRLEQLRALAPILRSAATMIAGPE